MCVNQPCGLVNKRRDDFKVSSRNLEQVLKKTAENPEKDLDFLVISKVWETNLLKKGGSEIKNLCEYK